MNTQNTLVAPKSSKALTGLIVAVAFAAASVAMAQTTPALPSGYTDISTAAAATFDWAKTFKIGIVVAVMVFGLIKLARGR